MSHSYCRIWIHGVWATKQRAPLLIPEAEKAIHDWMGKELADLGCELRNINGMPDHVHVLFRLNPKLAMMDVMKQVKGNTAHWINERGLLNGYFEWQRVQIVDRYIRQQKVHHLTQSFDEEFEYLVRMHGMMY
jgi:putative transposase